jgi:hypothetical protein
MSKRKTKTRRDHQIHIRRKKLIQFQCLKSVRARSENIKAKQQNKKQTRNVSYKNKIRAKLGEGGVCYCIPIHFSPPIVVVVNYCR